MGYRSGHYKTKVFRDYGNVSAEEALEGFLNELSNWNREDYQGYKIVNISMSVERGRTTILLVWKYV